jgi:glycosyltransferase involved in cell wall biosynthesis
MAGPSASFFGYEGLDLLVSAFANLVKDHDDPVFFLIEGCEIKQELETQIQFLGIESNVVMLGRIPYAQISGVY